MLRDATKEDVPSIIEMLEALHKISSFAPLDFSEIQTKRAIYSFIDSGQFVRVIDNEGDVTGVFIGIVAPCWFGMDFIAVDMSWYVKPKSRGRDSVLLVKEFIQWAKDKGAKQFRPGVSTGNESACRIYRKLGFTETGAGFSLEI
jgi:L-amino acid N-acyltransferase YncA